MLSQMAGLYFVAGIMSLVVMVAAVLAEGRGSHVIRLWLTRGRPNPREMMYAEMPREAGGFNVVAQLGASEVRYTELTARLEARAEAGAGERPDAAPGERTDAA
jgi:hypothetical protein